MGSYEVIYCVEYEQYAFFLSCLPPFFEAMLAENFVNYVHKCALGPKESGGVKKPDLNALK